MHAFTVSVHGRRGGRDGRSARREARWSARRKSDGRRGEVGRDDWCGGGRDVVGAVWAAKKWSSSARQDKMVGRRAGGEKAVIFGAPPPKVFFPKTPKKLFQKVWK